MERTEISALENKALSVEPTKEPITFDYAAKRKSKHSSRKKELLAIAITISSLASLYIAYEFFQKYVLSPIYAKQRLTQPRGDSVLDGPMFGL